MEIKLRWFAHYDGSLIYKIAVVLGFAKSYSLEKDLYLYGGWR